MSMSVWKPGFIKISPEYILSPTSTHKANLMKCLFKGRVTGLKGAVHCYTLEVVTGSSSSSPAMENTDTKLGVVEVLHLTHSGEKLQAEITHINA